MQGEKIDIVRWSENIDEYIQASLSPAEVSSVKVLSHEEKKAEVIVSDDQLSLAIGKNGQNVRLASKLTGWSIDIRSKKEIVKEKLEASMIGEVSQTEPQNIGSIEGIGPKTAEALAEAGFKTPEDLKNASDEALLAVKGVGKKALEKIRRVTHGVTSDETTPAEEPQTGEEK